MEEIGCQVQEVASQVEKNTSQVATSDKRIAFLEEEIRRLEHLQKNSSRSKQQKDKVCVLINYYYCIFLLILLWDSYLG